MITLQDNANNLTELWANTFISYGWSETLAWLTSFSISLSLFVFTVLLGIFIRKQYLEKISARIVERTAVTWDDKLREHGVFRRTLKLAVAVFFVFLSRTLFENLEYRGIELGAFLISASYIYVVLSGLFLIDATLNGMYSFSQQLPYARNVGYKGFVQAIKLVFYLAGIIIILSIVLDRSPVYFLSGLGAITAVLLLVFRDVILGFVAGIQITANNMLKEGDWIEMPSHQADGDVIDISLTTIKVQNWDKTITTIPAYDLIANPFKNWEGMSKSGGRRIKRALMIDMQTIRFADQELIKEFRKIALLEDYLEKKIRDIEEHNSSLKVQNQELINQRRLTNIGTFRAYCEAYLHSLPHISDEMTFLVRQLASGPNGLPIEIYVFSTDKRWVQYEAIQSDIFDHLLAVLPSFGLKVFQAPSGNDLSQLNFPETLS